MDFVGQHGGDARQKSECEPAGSAISSRTVQAHRVPREHNVHAKNRDRVLWTWFVSHSATAGTAARGMFKRAQTESDVRSLDELSPCNPSIGSRAKYELTSLRMLQVTDGDIRAPGEVIPSRGRALPRRYSGRKRGLVVSSDEAGLSAAPNRQSCSRTAGRQN